MKKILVCIIAAFLAVSCFKDAGFETNYTLDISFDGIEGLITEYGSDKEDSTAILPMFGIGPLVFFNSIGMDEGVVVNDIDGGWTLSMRRQPASSLFDAEGNEIPEQVALVTPHCAADTAQARGVNSYAVFHQLDSDMPEHDIEFTQAGYGTCTPSRLYLTNTTAVARYFMAKDRAVPGDHLTVTVTGYLGDTQTGKAKFELAYCSEAKDSVMLGWRPLDISALGSVQYIDFEIDSQFSAAEGEDLDYFCLDGLSASVHVKM